MVHKKTFRQKLADYYHKGWSTDYPFRMTKAQADNRVSFLKENGIDAIPIQKGKKWATLRKEKK